MNNRWWKTNQDLNYNQDGFMLLPTKFLADTSPLTIPDFQTQPVLNLYQPYASVQNLIFELWTKN